MNDEPMKILVVDDSDTILAFCKRLFEEEGFVVETSDSLWISQQVSRFRPDLVLIDIHLGVTLKGTVVVEALKNRPFSKETCLVLYSSISKRELRELKERCGAHGFISKDEPPEKLLSKVKNLLRESQKQNKVSNELDGQEAV